jgi:hypothetical protein
MTEKFRIRSMRVTKAEDALKKAIWHFVILDFNFPHEITECVTYSFLGLELLLKEILIQQGQYRDEISLPTMEKLIDEYDKWDAGQKSVVHWMRRKRNKIAHSGGVYWGELDQAKQNTIEVFELTGSLYQELDYEIDDIFNKFEASILLGISSDWRYHCDFLGKIARSYIDIDAETALLIANRAYEISLRGYAKSWGIENFDTEPLIELKNILYDYEITTDRTFVNLEQFNPSPYYLYHSEDEDEVWCPLEEFLLENIRLSDLDNIQGVTRQRGSEYAVKKYIEHVYDAVTSNIKRAVNLPYAKCFLDYFSTIMKELYQQFPNIKVLRLHNELGVLLYNFDEFWIIVHFDESAKEIGWNNNHDNAFRALILKYCGPLPDFVNFKLQWLKDFHPNLPHVNIEGLSDL